MLTKKQIDNYADVMLWGLTTARSGRFKKGDIVVVRYYNLALSLAEALHVRLLERGLNPVMKRFGSDKMDKDFYTIANNKQLTFVAPWEETYFNSLNGNIFINAPTSLTNLKDVDPKKMAKAAVSYKFARDIMSKREAEGLFGWTLCTFPTEELAKQAKLTLKQYSNQIAKACYLNAKDPVQAWKDLFKEAVKIKKWINRITKQTKHFHVESTNTDMIIVPGEKRRWMGVSGHNIPSFELFLSPDWRGTKGTYHANMPSFRGGNYVEGVTLKFNKGRATKVAAKKGENYVQTTLKMDKGACQIGEFSLTDKRFSKIDKFMADILFDENFGGKQGNCHIAVGNSYEDTYDGDVKELTKEKKEELGFNDSALHWDLINGEKKVVTAHLKNGKTKVIYENGMFTY